MTVTTCNVFRPLLPVFARGAVSPQPRARQRRLCLALRLAQTTVPPLYHAGADGALLALATTGIGLLPASSPQPAPRPNHIFAAGGTLIEIWFAGPTRRLSITVFAAIAPSKRLFIGRATVPVERSGPGLDGLPLAADARSLMPRPPPRPWLRT